MKITVIAEGRKKGWYARPMVASDLLNFAATMADWPPDEHGVFNFERSSSIIAALIAGNDGINIPVEYDFHDAWAVFDVDDKWIGYWRQEVSVNSNADSGVEVEAITRRVHITHLVIHPENRKKGFSQIIAYMQYFLVFEAYKADFISFEVVTDNTLMNKVNRRLEPNSDTRSRVGASGSEVVLFEETRVQYFKRRGKGANSTDRADGFLGREESYIGTLKFEP